MSFGKPTNHQELFNGFIRKTVSLIYETSGTIEDDCEELRAWAQRYATNNALTCSDNPDTFGLYQED